jgi:hypothetical protein
MSRLNKDSSSGSLGHQGDRQDDLNDPKEVVGECVMRPVECKEQAALGEWPRARRI